MLQFQDKYIGDVYIEARRREFLQMRQRQLSVFEYEKEFMRLSKYYPAVIATEEEKCKRFEQGLNSELQLLLAAQQFIEFLKLVKAAIRVEQVMKLEQNRKQQKRSFHGEQSGQIRPHIRQASEEFSRQLELGRGLQRQRGTESNVPAVSS